MARPEAGRLAGVCLAALLGSGAVFAQPAPVGTHRVQPGDTLWDISRQHLNTPLRWPDLQRGNDVAVPERLQPGQLITLPTAMRVAELAGQAWLKRGDQAQQPLALGTVLRVGDVLVTDRNAFLSLALADGSHVVVPSSTALRVVAADGRLTRLELLEGRLESHIEKQNSRHFEIRTRNAGLSVRGTHFRVRDEEGVSTSEVLAGAVSVQAAGGQGATVLLSGTRGALLAGPRALQPRDLLPAPHRLRTSEPARVLAEPLPQAARYRLQVARDERFLQLVHEALADTPAFAMPSDLEPGFYHTRLTALDADQVEGMPGDDVLLVGLAAPPAAAATQVGADGRIEIRWPAVQGVRYVFELSLSPDFAPVIASQDGQAVGGVTFGPLPVPGRYHWRVRPQPASASLPADAPQAGGWSGTFDLPAR